MPEDELHMFYHICQSLGTNLHKDHLCKDWISSIYALFEAIPTIEHIGACCSHVFKCASHGCKVTIHQYLDTKDAHSTGNMHKHAKKCLGDDAVNATDDTKDAMEAHTKVIACYGLVHLTAS